MRLLMEPITYANGSTLEDPALSYGIVFSNFMSKGVFTFQGGTDRLIRLMEEELRQQRRGRPHRLPRREVRAAGRRVEGVTRRRPADPRPGRRLQCQSEGDHFRTRGPDGLGRRLSWSRPGPCG